MKQPHDEYIKKVLKENGKPPGYKIVNLPCKHAKVELTEPIDRWVQCPTCHKAFFLVCKMTTKPKFTKVGEYR